MRLIDADALTQKESVMRKGCAYIEEINNAPTIDAEPIVMCTDCKWYVPQLKVKSSQAIEGFYYKAANKCKLGRKPPKRHVPIWEYKWFCADGERGDK